MLKILATSTQLQWHVRESFTSEGTTVGVIAPKVVVMFLRTTISLSKHMHMTYAVDYIPTPSSPFFYDECGRLRWMLERYVNMCHRLLLLSSSPQLASAKVLYVRCFCLSKFTRVKVTAAVGAKPCNFVNFGFGAYPMWLAGEVAGGKNDMC